MSSHNDNNGDSSSNDNSSSSSNEPWYNDPEQVQRIIKTEGLAGLSRVWIERERAFHIRGEWLTSMQLTPTVHSDYNGNPSVKDHRGIEKRLLTSIPTDKSRCPVCGTGWDLETCHIFDQSSAFPVAGTYLHPECLDFVKDVAKIVFD